MVVSRKKPSVHIRKRCDCVQHTHGRFTMLGWPVSGWRWYRVIKPLIFMQPFLTGLNIGAHKEAAEHFLSALTMQESTGGTSDQVWFTLRRTFLSMVSHINWKYSWGTNIGAGIEPPRSRRPCKAGIPDQPRSLPPAGFWFLGFFPVIQRRLKYYLCFSRYKELKTLTPRESHHVLHVIRHECTFGP